MNDFLASHSSDTYSPDQLLAEGQVRSRAVTIVSGQTVVRGAVLGVITATGKYAVSASAAGDGSEVATAIAAMDVDASGGDVTGALVYVGGDFNENQLTFGAGHDADSVRDQLRDVGIFIKPATAVE